MAIENFYMKAPANLGLSTAYAQYGALAGGGGDVVYDGDHKTAFACGAPTVSRPFQDLGDVTTKIVRQPVRQDMRYRHALAPGTPYNYPDAPDYTALHRNAIFIEETEPRDLGAHIGEWVRSYATVPPTIERPESYKFGYQYYKKRTDGSGNVTFAGFGVRSKQVASKVRREYFLLSQMARYPLLERPEYIELDTDNDRKVGDGSLYPSTVGTWFISDDKDFLAEDSLYEVWHYPIYCRKTRYVPPPTDAFWGATFTPPTPP